MGMMTREMVSDAYAMRGGDQCNHCKQRRDVHFLDADKDGRFPHYRCPTGGVTLPDNFVTLPMFEEITLTPKPIPAGGHAGYLRLLDEMRELHIRKAADYGRGVDPLANCRASAEFGVPAWVGVMIRCGDKFHRIKSFLQNGNLKNESVTDSLLDLAAYALIALTLYREEEEKKGGAA